MSDLVAAPPVPPVVPDSEPLALPASMLRPDDGAWYDKDDPDDQPSGSGVVPDKPALTCAVHDHGAWRTMYPGPCVPAVADDEAALTVVAAAFRDQMVDGLPSPVEARLESWFPEANAILSSLRSAGFLLVHPMQRGPEDPTFVMPDITAVHHTKET